MKSFFLGYDDKFDYNNLEHGDQPIVHTTSILLTRFIYGPWHTVDP